MQRGIISSNASIVMSLPHETETANAASRRGDESCPLITTMTNDNAWELRNEGLIRYEPDRDLPATAAAAATFPAVINKSNFNRRFNSRCILPVGNALASTRVVPYMQSSYQRVKLISGSPRDAIISRCAGRLVLILSRVVNEISAQTK